MKKIIYFLAISFASLLFYACQKNFLEIPNTTGVVDINKVFSSRLNAQAELFGAYKQALGYANNGENNFTYSSVASIAGERAKGNSWHPTYNIAAGGITANQTIFNYSLIYTTVRSLWIVNENIDKVPDMDATLKDQVKGETKGLLAYMYMYGLKAYGGIPLVKKSYSPSEDLTVPRATVEETVNYIVKLCDEAATTLPSTWPADQKGRLTKAAVLSIKAQTLMFAARPLFNSATPYLSLGGTNDKLISYGSFSGQRWKDAINASLAALTEAGNAGNSLINTTGTANVPNTSALADYGIATSTPGNKEVILASQDESNEAARYRNLSGYWTDTKFNNQRNGLLGNFLPNYRKADGTDQDWPKVGDAAPRAASDYITRFGQMEPRFRADFAGPGLQAANNPNDAKWGFNSWGVHIANYSGTNNFPATNDYGQGVAWPTKFYYGAGGRLWYEFPIFRVAELYLNLAEAYNEDGQTALALVNLNIIRNRGGLASSTETDKVKLKALIQREWAVEFYDENHRFFDVRHWRLPDIGNGIVGGKILEFQWQIGSASNKSLPSNLINYYMSVVYTAYWNDKMHLEPFPQSEVNKGAVIQNPGY